MFNDKASSHRRTDIGTLRQDLLDDIPKKFMLLPGELKQFEGSRFSFTKFGIYRTSATRTPFQHGGVACYHGRAEAGSRAEYNHGVHQTNIWARRMLSTRQKIRSKSGRPLPETANR